MRNKYKGICYRCGTEVAPGKGHFEKTRTGWRTQHAECAIKYRGTDKHYVPFVGDVIAKVRLEKKVVENE